MTKVTKNTKDELEDYKKELVRERERLKELQEKGDKACSSYDLMMGYDANFSMKLVSNHINYYEEKLNINTNTGLNRWL